MSLEKSASKNQDLTITISVNKTPAEVYDAIRDVKSWWTGDLNGEASKVGSQFTYQYKDIHTSTQKVTELIANKKVVWHVEDAVLSFVQNKTEWKGTDIVFEISSKGDGTEIKFTHLGLTPEVECFEACSGGWDFYITKSLKNFLVNGKGLDPGW